MSGIRHAHQTLSKNMTKDIFRANNFIRNNITRSLNILAIIEIDVTYCLLSNIWILESKAEILDNKQ